jgi:hypothetical protein
MSKKNTVHQKCNKTHENIENEKVGFATFIDDAEIDELTRIICRESLKSITQSDKDALTAVLNRVLPRETKSRLCGGNMSRVADEVSNGVLYYSWGEEMLSFTITHQEMIIMYFDDGGIIPSDKCSFKLSHKT